MESSSLCFCVGQEKVGRGTPLTGRSVVHFRTTATATRWACFDQALVSSARAEARAKPSAVRGYGIWGGEYESYARPTGRDRA